LKRPAVPGLPALVLSAALAKSQKWCTNIDPAVSIIIINWNATRLTFECVRQIWANTDDLHFEIIIVDNGSRPEQVRPLKSLGRGVRVMELGANRFFGEANNIAAETAKGRHLCFLNNDAFVRPGWLRSLVDVLDQAPDAGAVGPLFLFPDNTIQEAGAVMDERGYPVRLGRGSTLDAVEFLVPKTVDYVSAAMLLVSRELFLAVGGFDLAYEPAYYEDVDLCFKIRAFGKRVYYCPDAQVVHVEGSAVNGDPVAIARRTALGDLNRDKFTARWGAYLESRSTSDLVRIGHALKVHDRSPMSIPDGAKITAGAKTAAIFTPFLLTPGGGERYLLTLASAMTADYAVTLVTPHQYSSLRLLQLGREFSIDLSSCAITTEECFLSGPCPDLMVTLGSHIIPSIAARSRNSLYVCQFPFHLSLEEIRANKGLLAGYRAIVTYSEYVKTHVLAQLSAHQLPSMSVEVVHPPVPPMVGDGNAKRRVILSVGRFYVGGHNKRHDTMIRAFRAVLERLGSGVELHLAGSSMPMPEHMDHLNRLRELADGLPVVFHVNASPEKLSELYRDAAIYWHGTGLEADLERHPEEAEHFGITIVEAMAAECVVLAFNSGGPREVVTHGVDGFLYGSMEELLNLTLGILEDRCEDRRKAIGTAARARASTFFPHHFVRRVRELAAQPVERIPERAED
jgi:GT2 family glycosyltransferase/glycosyltransferase involved in cell wall biosynthesis